MIEYWIWLSQRQHLGAKGCLRLLQNLGTPEAVFSADRDTLCGAEGLTEVQLQSLLDKDLTEARRTLHLCFEKGIQTVTLHEKNYPAALRAIDDPPTVLYYLGTLPQPEDRPAIGIVGSHGCILSEYPPETPPVPENFPPRNRIISGLSDGVLVVEAAKKSGSLITAQRALEQNRDVFAVPGNIGNPACEGSNRLLQDGAGLVQSAKDVLSAYEFRYPQLSVVKPPEKPIDIDIPINYIDLKEIPKDLPEDAHAVILALGTDTLSMDELIAASGLSAGHAISGVTMLEVKGLVQRLPGKRYRRC